jgi:response regulator RpfG family c-di-GMP phosphodiesterase/DNA-binding CsgD family transcriptional regulator
MKSYKILIVDDSIQNLKTMVSIIEKYHPSYLIYQANSGRTALRVLQQTTPDIILTDWEMPDTNGIELLQILKNDASTRNIPAIIVTGVMVSSEDLKTAIEAGAMDYIRKPIVAVELLARMHSALTIAEDRKQIIKEKESKIIENVVFTNEVNNFLEKLLLSAIKIDNLSAERQEINKTLSEIVKTIENRLKGHGWQKYSNDYDKLHPAFQKRLLISHPSLTPAELKLATMIRLGLSIKELAGLMFVSPESMRVSRSRLRKKLGLSSEQNLQTYLSAI